MGFGAARPAPKPTMLVGFIGPAAAAAAARRAGAEVVVLEGKPSDLAPLRKDAPEMPLGASLSGNAPLQALKDAGADFLVFDAGSTPAEVLLEESLGHVLALPDSPEEGFLRSLESLSLEAVYIATVPEPLTVTSQLALARAATLSHKPLVCRVEAGATAEYLQCLRAAGAVVLLTSSADAVEALKSTVAGLPPRRQRREERPVVSLPRGRAPQDEDEDDDSRNGRA
jgi:hypothetical protein